jgi:hypothetical protein
MTDAGVAPRVRAGLDCSATSLPEAAWWDHYYGPMQAHLGLNGISIDAMAKRARRLCTGDRLYRDYASFYGYVFLIMSR